MTCCIASSWILNVVGFNSIKYNNIFIIRKSYRCRHNISVELHHELEVFCIDKWYFVYTFFV